jgi:hypothetical protein
MRSFQDRDERIDHRDNRTGDTRDGPDDLVGGHDRIFGRSQLLDFIVIESDYDAPPIYTKAGHGDLNRPSIRQ